MWSNENECEGMKMCVKELKWMWRNENGCEGMKMDVKEWMCERRNENDFLCFCIKWNCFVGKSVVMLCIEFVCVGMDVGKKIKMDIIPIFLYQQMQRGFNRIQLNSF